MRSSYLILVSSWLLPFSVVVSAQTPTEPCAAVSSVLAAQAKDNSISLPAEVAYQCLESVPIVASDATELLDAWFVFSQWQSDPTYKANPPNGYLYPSIDIFKSMTNLRDRVTSGNITRELDLQEGIRDIVYLAHDGHFAFQTDFNDVFGWVRESALVAVSSDGQSIPEVFLLPEQQLAYLGRLNYTPSPIAFIDGQSVNDFLTADYNIADTLQDPDAMYNGNMFSVAQPDSQGGGFLTPLRYPGSSTNLTFANGTERSFPNYAATNLNFTGVTDGATFYNKFLNATRKMIEDNNSSSGSGKAKVSKRRSSTHQLVEKRSNGPQPLLATDDGSFQAFVLTGSEELNRTAVIALNSFTSTNITQIQTLLGQFLKGCRQAGVDHLVLDLSGNTGGQIIVAYDIMRQLFPTLQPYFMRDYRAHPATNVLGQFFTNITSAILVDTHGNRTATEGPPDGGNSWDDTVFVDRNGKRFSSWPAFYGPISEYGDHRTKVFGFEISDTAWATNFADTGEPYAITGYGFNRPAPPQPFASENIVILGDGRCSSSCTTLSHFLKFQAKVKSIALGGRPQLGPMQQQGGIKGGNVAGHSAIAFAANELIHGGNPEFVVKQANSTILKALVEQADYLKYRTRQADDSESLSINLVNSVLANEAASGNDTLYADKETMPLQYIYEAADCRIFYTGASANYRTVQWITAANQAFGFNNTPVFSGCVEGSTNHPSSLSGDAKLFNNGKPVNVTDFDPPNTGGQPVDTSGFDLHGNRLVQYADQYVANLTGTASASANGTRSSAASSATASSGASAGLCTGSSGLQRGSLVLVSR